MPAGLLDTSRGNTSIQVDRWSSGEAVLITVSSGSRLATWSLDGSWRSTGTAAPPTGNWVRTRRRAAPRRRDTAPYGRSQQGAVQVRDKKSVASFHKFGGRSIERMTRPTNAVLIAHLVLDHVG